MNPMNISSTDRDILLATLNSKKSEIVQARMANALLLLGDGMQVEDVAELLYLDEATISGWLEMFTASKPRAAS
jgi:DNA-binding NarL/FixJ family response regulator